MWAFLWLSVLSFSFHLAFTNLLSITSRKLFTSLFLMINLHKFWSIFRAHLTMDLASPVFGICLSSNSSFFFACNIYLYCPIIYALFNVVTLYRMVNKLSQQIHNKNLDCAIHICYIFTIEKKERAWSQWLGYNSEGHVNR